MKPILFIVVLSILECIVSGQYLTSPCPKYFRYENDGFRTYGVIEVPPIQLGMNLRINIQLSIRAKLQNHYYGSLELLGTQQAALNSILTEQNIKYKVNFPLRQPIPKLVQILYNGHLICTGPPELTGYVTTIKLEHTLKTAVDEGNHGNRPTISNNVVHTTPNSISGIEIIVHPHGEVSARPIIETNNKPELSDFHWVMPDSSQDKATQKPATVSDTTQRTTTMPTTTTTPSTTTTKFTTTQVPSTLASLDDLLEELYGANSPYLDKHSTTESTIIKDIDVCGKPINSGNPLILNGTPTTRGEFPWLVAIYVKKTKNLEFHCGATLISNQAVLTAAHCINVQPDDSLTENEIVLFVGRNNIDDWTESGYTSPKVKQIIVHPDYKRSNEFSYDADIAVIVLKKIIEYSVYIRPACLWQGSTSLNDIVSHTGTVVGWGRDQEGIVTSTPNKVEMPIVSENTCLRSHESYRYLTSNRTFCAGKRDGTGPCNGDSGGPLTIFKNDRWYLRGIVSTSLYDAASSSCDVRNYIVFTDVAQFLPWIQSYL